MGYEWHGWNLYNTALANISQGKKTGARLSTVDLDVGDLDPDLSDLDPDLSDLDPDLSDLQYYSLI